MNMDKFKKTFYSFVKDEEGASGIEYALVAAMVAVALVAFVTPIRTAIEGIFGDIGDALGVAED